jgi:hypothetical protein
VRAVAVRGGSRSHITYKMDDLDPKCKKFLTEHDLSFDGVTDVSLIDLIVRSL